jgi:hypothetical protein
MTAVAYVTGLERADGRVVGVKVRCPLCSRVHLHRHRRLPIRGPVKAPCSPFGTYTVDFHTPATTAP